MKLSWNGRQNQDIKRNTFFIIVVIWIATIIARMVAAAILGPMLAEDIEKQKNSSSEFVTWTTIHYILLQTIYCSINVAFGIFIIIVMMRARYYIRQRSQIPERQCYGCEDLCCSIFCSCCTLTQMARHTADYDLYRAVYCSDTGMPCNAPLVI